MDVVFLILIEEEKEKKNHCLNLVNIRQSKKNIEITKLIIMDGAQKQFYDIKMTLFNKR